MSDETFKAWHDRYGFTRMGMSRVIDFKTRKLIVPEGGIDITPDVVAALSETTPDPISPDKVLMDKLNTLVKPDEHFDSFRRDVNTGQSTLTAQELHKKLYEKSATDIGGLISFYKQTGNWNPITERLMGRVVEDIKAICFTLAGVK